MKIPRPGRTPRTDVDMVPMINFAFLLLIFFMLVGRFGPLEVFAVQPPRASASAVVAPTGDGEMLLLGADGALAFGHQRLEAADLASRAAAWRGTHPGHVLTIKADARADARQLVDLLDILRGAGIAEVRLLTRPPVAP